jgi:hypothetical protein
MTTRRSGNLVLVPHENGRVSWELQLGTASLATETTFQDDTEAMRDAHEEASELGLGIVSVTDHWGRLVVLS